MAPRGPLRAMRNLLHTLLVSFVCLLLVAAPAEALAPSARTKKVSESELRRRADKAAAGYSRAQAAVARLGNDIDRLEKDVAKLQAKMAPLREAVTRRAVAVYQARQGIDAIAGLSTQPDLVQSARGAILVAHASAADLAVIEGLNAARAKLRDRQEAIVTKRQDQEAAMTDLDSERKVVELELAVMARARQDLQSRLVAAPRSARASRGESGRREVPPPPALQSPEEAAAIPVATNLICPIAGPLAFTDSWGDPRGGGRRHKGTDLMNPFGTPNVAVVSGQIARHHSGAGGLSIYLYGDDGNTYYYAHLAEVVGPDRRVAQGEVVATTGNSGNARGGSPHTHFEIHPGGAEAVNPYPSVRAVC
jgi:murein DD-endopeptidase MepM/ murein hydrolase activator NlpD